MRKEKIDWGVCQRRDAGCSFDLYFIKYEYMTSIFAFNFIRVGNIDLPHTSRNAVKIDYNMIVDSLSMSYGVSDEYRE